MARGKVQRVEQHATEEIPGNGRESVMGRLWLRGGRPNEPMAAQRDPGFLQSHLPPAPRFRVMDLAKQTALLLLPRQPGKPVSQRMLRMQELLLAKKQWRIFPIGVVEEVNCQRGQRHFHSQPQRRVRFFSKSE